MPDTIAVKSADNTILYEQSTLGHKLISLTCWPQCEWCGDDPTPQFIRVEIGNMTSVSCVQTSANQSWKFPGLAAAISGLDFKIHSEGSACQLSLIDTGSGPWQQWLSGDFGKVQRWDNADCNGTPDDEADINRLYVLADILNNGKVRYWMYAWWGVIIAGIKWFNIHDHSFIPDYGCVCKSIHHVSWDYNGGSPTGHIVTGYIDYTGSRYV